ncbi:hypothetical protein NEMBOFW57_003300 [Staphylotrichum longicolle]|uniref:Nephrocystin 3-like N-terminal domain-containing protein n=1 Tax=Staphylotrichum longicolle TaxID=669026 RepID=A0AAD4HZF2_9PEZI|nr:hypothetical protein NEMBOFW57_003300 [Staphylotrichum longicolle]
MASLMLSAARAKPQVRLGHALSEFEMALSDDRKAASRAHRSQAANSQLGLEDVRRAVAEFDKSGSRPLGGRFVHVLQAVQRFAVFGDVIVGDSVSLREKVSELFRDLGRTAPRHEQLSVLYPRSKRLQADLTEYFILLVQLCQKLFQSSTLARIAAHVKLALSDPELKNLKEQLDRWALSIDREVTLLIATRVEEEAKEQSRLRELWACVSEHEVKRRKMKTRLAWLDRCSEYDHTAELKRLRKQGNTTYFMGDPDYKAWKDRDASSTLLCRGTLGSGKSVLMANMVDDLVLSKTGEDCSIAYFFICDDRESMRARTILGCLARQLLEVLPHQTWNGDLLEQSTRLDIEGITRLLCRLIPDSRRLVIVVDALDQCPRHERIELFKQLKCLRQTFQVLVCGSLRVEANLQPEADFQELDPEFVFEIPLVNPEIARFVENQLQVLLQSGELAVRDPNLVDEIRAVLLTGRWDVSGIIVEHRME